MGLLERLAAVDRRLRIDFKSERRGSKRLAVATAVSLSLIFMVPVVAALWNGKHDREVAAKLRREGAVADGQIVDVRPKGALRSVAGEEVKVAFRTAAGENVTTWVTVGDGRRGPTVVRYLRSDPSTARLVEDPVPRGGVWPVAVGGFYLVGWIGCVVLWALRRRRPW